MTATGIGPANSAMSSAEPARRECVDALVRQRRDLRRKLFDPTRDEGAIDEIAQPRVLGRLELQHRMALERVEGLKMRLRARGQPSSARLITCRICRPKRRSRRARKRRRGGRSTRSHIPPRRMRARFADRCVGGIGIAEETGVARIEANAAARGVDGRTHGPAFMSLLRIDGSHDCKRGP